ncbi:hypothetical protein HDV06_001490 [Boothiomyces sp. JEL0866]|nr:hypothetical protein HDV06_001490 [Boothiomyces sp. JEL0866]
MSRNKRKPLAARSGSDWDKIYLERLGISIKDVNYDEMFNINETTQNIGFERQDVIDELLKQNWKNFDFDENCKDVIQDFISCLEDVLSIKPREESSVDELGFKRMKLHVHGPTNIEYNLLGDKVYAKPDIAIMDKIKKIYLVVQEDKSFSATKEKEKDTGKAESQLAAEMIGAFYTNVEDSDIKEQEIYGIVMLEILYKIMDGEDSGLEIKRYSLGEKDPSFLLEKENLIKTFKCYESLKEIIKYKIKKHIF